MEKYVVAKLPLETYLTLIQNSLGSKLFRNLPVKMDGKRTDALNNGRLSCAFYASSILLISGLIKRSHATVNATVKDLKKSGWKKIPKPKKGAVLIWEPLDQGNNEPHRHIGFYVGNNQAVSNSYKKGFPITHHWTYGDTTSKTYRKVELILWNPKL